MSSTVAIKRPRERPSKSGGEAMDISQSTVDEQSGSSLPPSKRGRGRPRNDEVALVAKVETEKEKEAAVVPPPVNYSVQHRMVTRSRRSGANDALLVGGGEDKKERASSSSKERRPITNDALVDAGTGERSTTAAVVPPPVVAAAPSPLHDQAKMPPWAVQLRAEIEGRFNVLEMAIGTMTRSTVAAAPPESPDVSSDQLVTEGGGQEAQIAAQAARIAALQDEIKKRDKRITDLEKGMDIATDWVKQRGEIEAAQKAALAEVIKMLEANEKNWGTNIAREIASPNQPSADQGTSSTQ